MNGLWIRNCADQPFVSLGDAALSAVERLAPLAGHVMADPLAQNCFDYWEAQLRGEEPDLPRNLPMFGRYWRRQRDGVIVGIAIDPDDDDVTPVVRIAKQPPFALQTPTACEDFCELQFSWFCRNAVSHEAYLHWWKTGEWPDGAIKEKPKASRGRKAAAPKAAEPVVAETAAVAPGIRIKVYQTLPPAEASQAFYARAIRFAKGRETTSVGFYGETASIASAKAAAWIETEREKVGRSASRRGASASEQSATAA